MTEIEVIEPNKTPVIEVQDTTMIIRAEIDASVATAKAYPRDLARAKNDIQELACSDPETAQSCFFSLPRGGKAIIGPSIRMAEIVAYCWEHLRIESRVVGMTDKTITCEAKAWDMQKNIMATKTVQRKITDKFGRTYKDDMIVMTGNAGCAIAERNAIFKVIPPAVLKNIMDAIKVKAIEGFGKVETQVANAIKYFEEKGIAKELVLAKLDRRKQSEIDENDLMVLRSIINTVNDGGEKISTFFDIAEDPKPADTGKVDFDGNKADKGKKK